MANCQCHTDKLLLNQLMFTLRLLEGFSRDLPSAPWLRDPCGPGNMVNSVIVLPALALARPPPRLLQWLCGC